MAMNYDLIVISQNLFKYDMKIPDKAVLRINLAWHKKLKTAAEVVAEYMENKIFLDVPIGRRKPPNFSHKIEDVAVLALNFPNIEYVAVSNIENVNQVRYYQVEIPGVKIVPKIETFIGIKNARDIIEALNYDDKVVMLDHQDLYSDLAGLDRRGEYLELVDNLAKICREEGCCLLRTVGVVFAEWKEE